VPLKTYDESLGVLRGALDRAKVGDPEKMEGMVRLNRFVEAIEKRVGPEADFDAAMAHERKISKSLGGRTVMDDRKSPRQLPLF